ncbi:MAG: RelA/SpoT family protein [Betaproteobacteria bacterium]
MPVEPPATTERASPAPGLARRAADALWRAVRRDSDPDNPPPPGVVSFAELTELLRKYLPAADVQRIKAAFRFSDQAHLGQFRKSGEPYITHPIAVAKILAEWKLDAAAIQAALLHDVLEDSGATKAELTERFGATVAELVDGVSKLDRLAFDSFEQAQAESFRKMLLAMARDVRVILIKLADRLHNVRTLDAMAPAKRRRIGRETLEVYAPIAYRLGLNALYLEMQDQAFARLYPRRAAVLARALAASRGTRAPALGRIADSVRKALKEARLKAEVGGREKTLYAIYRKMAEKHHSFRQVQDVLGFRIVVGSRGDCYLALGVLHALYKPVPGRFKDYIALPKDNGYQSLHTVVTSTTGLPIEFQIRTAAMNRVAESGVAAHWLYKGDDHAATDLQARTHEWLQSLLELQSQSDDSTELMENIKVDLFPDKVYVFTPRGRIVTLPRGATPVDFAYGIHTDVGNKTVATRVNGDTQPLRTVLRNGDTVEIVTGPLARPNPGWLEFVRSAKARAEIRHYLRTMKREESVALGERLLAQATRQLGIDLDTVPAERWDAVLKATQAPTREDILADMGLGRRLAAVVARRLAPTPAAGSELEDIAEQSRAAFAPALPVTIRGNEGMAVQMARCCAPIPGDAIVGHMRRDQGLAVHQADCVNARRARRAEPERWIDLVWADQTQGVFGALVDVAVDNQRGVLARVAAAIAEAEANIDSVAIEEEASGTAVLHFRVQVADRPHLARVLRALRRVRQVSRVQRVRAPLKPGRGDEG